MARISGNANDSGSVCVINQDTDLVDYFEDISAGQYLVGYVPEGHKTVIFVKENGYAESFGDVFSTNPAIAGAIYSCGNNNNGQLGLGNIKNISAFSIVGLDSDWGNVGGGISHTLVVKTNGTLWACGANNAGQLGQNNTTKKSTFTQVGTDTSWKSTSGGDSHTLALKTDGTLWSWGFNNNGQLGLNLAVSSHKSTPTKIGSDTNWASVSCGYYHTAALKTTGTLWTCGNNGNGQLGLNLGATLHKSVLTQVGVDTDWASVSCGSYHTIAIKTNGTMWIWGFNGYGQLGRNDITTRSAPIQIGSATNWKSASGGYGHTVAVKTDGTLWGCGYNAHGQLGQNNIINKSTFTQIGTDTDWKSVNFNNGYHIVVLKNDNTLWVCGNNGSGQLGLGLGSTVHKSTLTQVGSAADWVNVVGVGNSSLFTK